MTAAESQLWYYLRDRRLGGFKFRRQVAIGPYIVDFASIEAMLIIEADGGQHCEQEESDQVRTAYLETVGFQVLRFWNDQILNDTLVVLECIHSRLPTPPHPNPSPRGRGA